jgi:hypothetical protein
MEYIQAVWSGTTHFSLNHPNEAHLAECKREGPRTVSRSDVPRVYPDHELTKTLRNASSESGPGSSIAWAMAASISRMALSATASMSAL